MFIRESYTLKTVLYKVFQKYYSIYKVFTKYFKNYEKTYTVYKGFQCLANGGQKSSVFRENRNTGVWSMPTFICNNKSMLAYSEAYFFAV